MKACCEPDVCSANATAASLPETIIKPFIKSDTETWVFKSKNINEEPGNFCAQEFSVTVTISLFLILPVLSASPTT